MGRHKSSKNIIPTTDGFCEERVGEEVYALPTVKHPTQKIIKNSTAKMFSLVKKNAAMMISDKKAPYKLEADIEELISLVWHNGYDDGISHMNKINNSL